MAIRCQGKDPGTETPRLGNNNPQCEADKRRVQNRRSQWPLTNDEALSASTPDGSIKEQSSASEDISLPQAVTDAGHSTKKTHALATLHSAKER